MAPAPPRTLAGVGAASGRWGGVRVVVHYRLCPRELLVGGDARRLFDKRVLAEALSHHARSRPW